MDYRCSEKMRTHTEEQQDSKTHRYGIRPALLWTRVISRRISPFQPKTHGVVGEVLIKSIFHGQAAVNIVYAEIIDGVASGWFVCYGWCSILITDRGPGYVGGDFGRCIDTWGAVRTMIANMASHRNGMVGRQAGLTEEGFKMAKHTGARESVATILKKATLARNIAPLFPTGTSPLAAMCGRNDILADMEKSSIRKSPNS